MEQIVEEREDVSTKSRSLGYALVVLSVAAVYFGAARLGLLLGIVEQVTVVWPPTGIALAAVVLYGYRIWPGVALGAFLANFWAHEPLVTVLGVAVGNTLEAVIGAWLLERCLGFRAALARLKDVVALLFLAAGLSTMVSATVGVTSLCLGGVHPWSRYGSLWWIWWLGDGLGDLVIAPLLLTWATAGRPRLHRWRVAEASALLVGLIAVSLTVFAGGLGTTISRYPLEYAVFPFVIWSALRFGPRATTLVTFLVSAIGIVSTVHGFGPFMLGTTLHERLILLGLFMGVVASTGLILAATMSERNTTAQYRAAAYAATQVLAGSAPSTEAVSGVLAAIGHGFRWDIGALWEGPRGNVLAGVWHDPSAPGGYAALIGRQTMSAGVGLPGRVWNGDLPRWLTDPHENMVWPWEFADEKRLRTAFAVPIRLEGKLLGMMEFFSHARRELDPDLLQLTAALGAQVGLFLERRRAEERLRHEHSILQAVNEGTLDAIFVKDLDSRYLMLNPAGARLVGKAVHEVLGRDDTALFEPETARRIMADDRRIMESGATETFEEVATAAGVTRTYLSTKGPYRDLDGTVIGLIGITRDITDRKRAEEERKRQLEVLRTIFDHIPVMIIFFDPAGRIQMVNRHWEEVLGWSFNEARNMDRLAEFYPDPQYRQYVMDFIRQGARKWADFKTRARDGHTIDTSWANVVLSDGTSIGIGKDITERKQAEEALRQNTERLQALSRQLLEVQETERRHLARELHDEIGQLLTSAEFALKASVSDLPATAGDKLREARALIGEALDRVRELSFNLRPPQLDLLGLLPALRSLLQHYTASTGIRVNFHEVGLESRLAPDLETAAYRIIQEALTNVARHAGVKETVVRIWVNADQVELQVEDEGVGFDQEAALAASRSSGLLGMYERVRLLGGRLTIESAPGGGTHLLAQLPVRNQARGDGP